MRRAALRDERDVLFRHADGTVYPATDGVIELDNRAHVDDLGSVRDGTVRLLPLQTSLAGAPGVTCRCGFNALAAFAGSPCPRCGATL